MIRSKGKLKSLQFILEMTSALKLMIFEKESFIQPATLFMIDSKMCLIRSGVFWFLILIVVVVNITLLATQRASTGHAQLVSCPMLSVDIVQLRY